METIRNYLETMFMNLPSSPEIYRAKNELWQMMEDKYTELLENGKSENEAVGTVIAEFGNLDELAEDLGIAQFLQQESKVPQGKPFPLETVKEYLADKAKNAFYTALGVFFCIISVCGPIFFGALAEYFDADGILGATGGCSLFVLAAVGVGILVYSGVRISKWKNIGQEHYVTDFSTTEYIHQEMEKYKGTHALLLTVGIVLCILSVIPPMIMDEFSAYSEIWDYCSGAFLFLMVGIGVFLIVMSSMKLDSYNTLLRLNQKDTIGGNYVPNQQNAPQYISEGVAVVMSVFWPTVTCLYLIWSFLTFDWWKTWIIWPLAGIIHSVIKNTLKKQG